jgi:hypothetical protein
MTNIMAMMTKKKKILVNEAISIHVSGGEEDDFNVATTTITTRMIKKMFVQVTADGRFLWIQKAAVLYS